MKPVFQSFQYLIMISSYTVYFSRNLLPLLPFVALLAGRFIDLTISFVATKFYLTGFRQLGLFTFLMIMTVARPLYITGLLNTWLVQREDVRTSAATWIAENISPDSRIFVEGYAPPLSRKTFTVIRSFRAVDHPPEWYGQEGNDYIIFSPMVYERAFRAPQQYATEIEQYQTLFREFTLVKEIEGWFWSNCARGTIKIYQVPYFLSHFDEAKIQLNGQLTTTAVYTTHRAVSSLGIDDILKPTLYQHPLPDNELSIVYPAMEVHPDTALRFSVGLDPQVYSSGKGDGVTFKLYVSQPNTTTLLFAKYIDPKNSTADRRWHDYSIDLTDFAGQSVDFKFATTPGPMNNPAHDWAHWGSPRFVGLRDTNFPSTTQMITSLISYAAPILLSPKDGAVVTGTVTLKWQWDEPLLENEYFDVRVWQENEPHWGIAWTKQRQYEVDLNKLGKDRKSYWSVAIIRGKNNAWEDNLSLEASTRTITFTQTPQPEKD